MRMICAALALTFALTNPAAVYASRRGVSCARGADASVQMNYRPDSADGSAAALGAGGSDCGDGAGAPAGGAAGELPGGDLIPVLPGGTAGGDEPAEASPMSLKEQRAAAAMSFIYKEKRLALAGTVTKRGGVRLVSATVVKPAPKEAAKPAAARAKAPVSAAGVAKQPAKPAGKSAAKSAPRKIAKKGKPAAVPKETRPAPTKLPPLPASIILAPSAPPEAAALARAGEPVVEPAVDSDTYKIKSGDVLSLRSYPEGKLPPSVTVRPDGTITLPIVGVTLAQGHTVFELSDIVVEKLKQYIKFPWVEFSVGESSAKKIRVFGEVVRPGIIILKENFKVIDILPQMGGFTNFSDTGNVRLIHADGSETRLDIDKVVQNPAVPENALLQNGDILFVSRLEQGKDIIRVLALGAFNKQGPITLSRDRARLMDAISETGGFTSGADLRNVKVMALDEGGAKERASVDVEKVLLGKDLEGMNVPLNDGDILFAPALDTKKKQKKLDKANDIFKTYSPTIGLLILLQNNAK